MSARVTVDWVGREKADEKVGSLFSGIGGFDLGLDLMELCLSRGHDKLSTRTEQPWHEHIDDRWDAWINATSRPASFKCPGQMDGEVPPFTAWINYNGWLWGLVDPYGGVHGEHPNLEGANAASFARACLIARGESQPEKEPA